jgi:hypothetical protein
MGSQLVMLSILISHQHLLHTIQPLPPSPSSIEHVCLSWTHSLPKILSGANAFEISDIERMNIGVVRKNSVRLPSDRDVGTYLFGLRDLEDPGSQLGWQKIPLSLTDRVPS